MMADQLDPKTTKFEGIVVEEALERAKKQVDSCNQELLTHFLKIVEPVFYKNIIVQVKKDRDRLRSLGASGNLLDAMSDIASTELIRGFLIHRNAVSLYDEKKLVQMTSETSEQYYDRLIDEYLENKKKAEATKPQDTIQSVEPDKSDRKPEDLVDE